MTLQLADNVRNAMLDSIESTIGTLPVMKVRTGAVPATCATADAGTVVSTINLPSDWMAAASGGTAASSAEVVFDVPGSTTITHIGYWSASTAGTFYGSRSLDASQTYATAGTYTLAIGNITESLT